MSGIADWVGDNAGNATHPGNGMRQAAGPGHFNDRACGLVRACCC